MVDDRIVALHFGLPGINKMCSDSAIFWWPNMREDIERKSETCSACLNAGKNLKFQTPQTKTSKLEQPKTPGEEIQIDLTENLHNNKLSTAHINCGRQEQSMASSKNMQKNKLRNRNFISEGIHECIRSTETNKIG